MEMPDLTGKKLSTECKYTGKRTKSQIFKEDNILKKMTKFERSGIGVKSADAEFSSVFDLITRRRSRALMAVNVESLMTYWEIGAFLSPRIHSGSWSTAIVGQLADYLKRKDPTLRGYGKSSLYNMVAVYDAFSGDEFLALVGKYDGKGNFFQSLIGKSCERDEVVMRANNEDNIFQPVIGKCMPRILCTLSFTNLVRIVNNCNDVQERLFYIVYSCRERLTSRELVSAIDCDSYHALLGGDKKNYSKKLKEFYPTAPVVIKDQAFLDYLSLPEKHKEPKLRREIVAHIRDFILEMGKDFLFVDQEYVLPVGGEDFKADLLFYHRGLQCLVAFELKSKKFHPKDLGQLEFYLEALDRDVKKENENPSIGVILCKSANKIVVEYAMSRTMSPVMVAQYKQQFIPKEVLQRTFEEYLVLPDVFPEEKSMTCCHYQD